MQVQEIQNTLTNYGISFTRIAEVSGYTPQHVSRYFAGKYKRVNFKIITAAIEEINMARRERKALESKVMRILERA